MLVYHSTLRVTEHGGGLLLQDLDAPGEKLRGTQIIVMRPLEVLAGRQLDGAVAIARGSRAAYSRQISPVASVEALSEMISSKSRNVCASTASKRL